MRACSPLCASGLTWIRPGPGLDVAPVSFTPLKVRIRGYFFGKAFSTARLSSRTLTRGSPAAWRLNRTARRHASAARSAAAAACAQISSGACGGLIPPPDAGTGGMPLAGIGMSIAFASPCVDALLIVRRRRSGRTVQFDGVRSETDHAFAVGALESGVADCGVFAGE